MKLLLSMFVLFVVTLGEVTESSEDFEKFVIEQAEICRKQVNATAKDVKEMIDGVQPTTRVAKCLNECFMDKLGVIEDGKFMPKQLIEMYEDDDTTKAKDGKTLKESIKDIVNACKTVTDKDKCEFAAKLLSCLDAEAQKRGFGKDVF